MRGHPFTDSRGHCWLVIDYQSLPGGGRSRKRPTPLGSSLADARAFVPVEWSGDKADVWIYRFGPATTRFFEPDILEGQLACSHPATATAAERMQPSPRRRLT